MELLPTSPCRALDSAPLPAVTCDHTHRASPTRRFTRASDQSLCGASIHRFQGLNHTSGLEPPAWPSLEAGLTSPGSHRPTSKQLVGPSGLATPHPVV